ncbi:MAG: FHA domain-containing protein [Clostridium sp.]|uniref:FHA domain-containing protein n=1 Tax=Clostridium TaxID=1485 RepID=UPI001883F563|nr:MULTISPECIES: FHA domain-containing protein [Clostridium]MCR6513898.1 FHA domain-containing protein [Clostridium sp. LY3-2]
MSFSKIIGGVFGIIFIVILYFIIFYALKIMAKDVKNGEKKKRPVGHKHHGIEVIASGENNNLKVGTIIPIKTYMSIGRTDDNTIILTDKYVSGKHARILVKNNVLILEDLGSTNGTYLNGQKIQNKVKLFTRDEIRIGTAVFKVLT